MRHRKSGLKLGKTTSHRQSMFKNMVTSLFKHDRIRTTDVKAKELRRWADHVITLAKRGDLHARRQVMNIIRDKAIVHKLFENASEKYSSRSGGYTRIVKIGRRAGDAAPVSLIELIGSDKEKTGVSKPKKKATPPAPIVAPSVTADEKKPTVEVESKESAADAAESGEQTDEVAGDSVVAASQEVEEASGEAEQEKSENAPEEDKTDKT